MRYPAFVKGGAAAVRWAAAHASGCGGDGRALVLMDHSSGAYIAAMLAVDGRWRGEPRAAMRGLVGLTGRNDLAPFGRSQRWK